jgi:hypothetical protein
MLSLSVGEMASHAGLYALRPALAGTMLVMAAMPWAVPALRFLRLAR